MSTQIFTSWLSSWKLKAEVLLSSLHLPHIKNQTRILQSIYRVFCVIIMQYRWRSKLVLFEPLRSKIPAFPSLRTMWSASINLTKPFHEEQERGSGSACRRRQICSRVHAVVESACLRHYVMILQCSPRLLQGQSFSSSLAESCGTAHCQCSYLQF